MYTYQESLSSTMRSYRPKMANELESRPSFVQWVRESPPSLIKVDSGIDSWEVRIVLKLA